jgi:hypothetical protein
MEGMEKDNRVDIMIYSLGGVSIALGLAALLSVSLMLWWGAVAPYQLRGKTKEQRCLREPLQVAGGMDATLCSCVHG